MPAPRARRWRAGMPRVRLNDASWAFLLVARLVEGCALPKPSFPRKRESIFDVRDQSKMDGDRLHAIALRAAFGVRSGILPARARFRGNDAQEEKPDPQAGRHRQDGVGA